MKNYHGDFSSITFFAKETSTIYKVVDSASKEYALKIYDDASSNIADNEIEQLILEKIKTKGSILIAETIPNKAGETFTLLPDKATKTLHRIVLSKWIKGVDFKKQESKVNFIQLGKVLAELHTITKDFSLPKKLDTKKWNQVFYFRAEKAVYHSSKYQQLVSSEFKELMDIAIPLLNQRLQDNYVPETAQLLHGDINPWNVKVVNEQLALLDFEDATLGHPIHEIAILLFYYKDHPDFTYQQVKSWVLEGYRSIKFLNSAAENTIQLLMMARNVNFLNYVLTLEEDRQEFIKKGLAELKLFLDTY